MLLVASGCIDQEMNVLKGQEHFRCKYTGLKDGASQLLVGLAELQICVKFWVLAWSGAFGIISNRSQDTSSGQMRY